MILVGWVGVAAHQYPNTMYHVKFKWVETLRGKLSTAIVVYKEQSLPG